MLFKKIKQSLPVKKECLQIQLFENENIVLLSKKEFNIIKEYLSEKNGKIIVIDEEKIIEKKKINLFEEEKEEKQLLSKKREFKDEKSQIKDINNFEKISKAFIKKKKKEEEEKLRNEIMKNFKCDEYGICHLDCSVGEFLNAIEYKKKLLDTLRDDKISTPKSFFQKREELFKRIKLLSKEQILDICILININNSFGAKTLTIEDIKKNNYSLIKSKTEEFETINKKNPNFKSFEELEKENEKKEKEDKLNNVNDNIILNDMESISD